MWEEYLIADSYGFESVMVVGFERVIFLIIMSDAMLFFCNAEMGRISASSKWSVLVAALPLLSPRLQAKLRAVSNEMNNNYINKSITAPNYAFIIEELVSFAHSSRHVMAMSLSGKREEIQIRGVKMLNGRVRVELVADDWAFPDIITTCKPENLKYVLYRAIESNRVLKRCGNTVCESFVTLAAVWEELCMIRYDFL